MQSLVCISITPDTTARIAFTPDQSAFDKTGVQHILNPYDEWYALVRAIELREQLGGEVTILSVGTATNDTLLRKALAIGADRAIRVDAEPRNAFYVARQIAAIAESASYDLIFLGKETIDYNGSEVGSMVAELLNLPFISFANHLETDSTSATVTREIAGGEEVVQVSLPVVLSASKGMAEQRIPNMQGILRAKRKPLTVQPPIDVPDLVHAVHFELPPAKSGVQMIEPDQMDELVRLLREEAKVL